MREPISTCGNFNYEFPDLCVIKKLTSSFTVAEDVTILFSSKHRTRFLLSLMENKFYVWQRSTDLTLPRPHRAKDLRT